MACFRAHSVLIFGAVAVGLAAVASRAIAPPPQRPSVAPAERSLDPSRRVAPEIGRELSYRLSMRSDVTASGQAVLSLELSGTWAVAPLGSGALATLMRTELRDVAFQSRTARASDAPALDAYRAGFTRPFYFVADSTGAVTETRSTAGTPSFVAGVLKAVIAAVQLVHPGDHGQSWTTTETDTIGRYEAEYRLLSPVEYGKRKRRYVEILGGANAAGRAFAEILGSETRYTLGENGAIESLRASEHTRVRSAGGPMPSLETTTTLSLDVIKTESVAMRLAQWNASAEAAEKSTLYAAPLDEARTLDADIARIRDMTVESVLTRLRALRDATREERTERARLYSALAALLRREPAALAAALERIEKAGPDAALVIDALGDAGTPAAQAALQDLALGRGASEDDRKRALLALSFARAPSPETVTVLSKLMDDPALGGQAMYGLGAAVHELSGSAPGRADAALEILLKALRTTSDPLRVSMLLRALGNAAHLGALGDIDAYLSHPDPAVRAAAVEALRKLPGPRADSLLVEAMLSDPSATVRRTAAEVAGERSISAPIVSAVQVVARTDGEGLARAAALRTAIQWFPRVPSIAETLAWVAEHDVEAALRLRALHALAAAEEAG